MVAFLVAGLAGCAQGPVFDGITEIIVHTQTPGGTKDEPLEGEVLGKARECLASTLEIPQPTAQAETELLSEILLLQIKDRRGDRMFEFTTMSNFSARGKFYENKCMYRILKQR